MNGGGGGDPPSNGGEFLLHLLRNRNTSHPSPSPPQTFAHDPAIAAVGPSIQPAFLPHNIDFSYSNWQPGNAPSGGGGYFQQNPSSNPNQNPNLGLHQLDLQSVSLEERRQLGFADQNRSFGVGNRDLGQKSGLNEIQVDLARLALRGSGNERGREGQIGNYRMGQAPPPGFSNRMSSGNAGNGRAVERNVDKGKGNFVDQRSNRADSSVGAMARSNLHSVPGFEANGRAVERNVDKGKGNFVDQRSNRVDLSIGGLARNNLHSVPAFEANGRVVERNVDRGKGNFAEHQNDRADSSIGAMARSNLHSVPAYGARELVLEENDQDLKESLMLDDNLVDEVVRSLVLEDESGEKNDKKKHHRDKDYRSDKRGQWIMGQKMRNQKSFMACRHDINRLNAPLLSLFESLIPADEEKIKQKQLLTLLEKLVSNEWPEARLYLYGSCGNSFAFSKSDIDICLAMELGSVEKSVVLLKLAEIFESENLQNVQALTRARVPIVKLMDPVTGISCDICINNLLAVVNTKLLRDYSKIDVRLRQLVFLVKHWAKSRGVNETYHGTLSSYAYVLMCIHFLQRRRPAILPCLQGMDYTYYATVDNVEYGFFDKVEKFRNFGSQNRETIAQLLWGFFHYWAYCHDFANDVISVRTGHTLSKRDKDWTRRVGNDRHLICIEDPFEVSHDLGRVVDKFSIRVLREEFERAAHVMQFDPNPCATLFEPYNP